MLKYISKFVLDILPSVVATIVGAYIVNHYIIPKSDTAKPEAAVASTPDPKPATKAVTVKPRETSSDLVSAPDSPASRAKGSDKPVVEKSDKPDVASAPSEPRRHQPAPRDKAVAKVTSAPAAAAPVATVSPAPAQSAPTAEERRDANDLARAAIERLRSVKETPPATQEAVRIPETPRVPEAPRVQESARSVEPAPMPQLPPPILVTTPRMENFNANAAQPASASERAADPSRPQPPGDIPSPPPLDLRADATGAVRKDRPNVAEDVLSAAKSVFKSVIPRQFE